MGIVVDSNLPNLVLQLNAPQRTIFYKGMTKNIPDEYWKTEVVPKLYPLWDSDKDKLIMFTWYDNNTYHAERRKYLKNFQTGEFYWKDYEMEQIDSPEASELYDFFHATFYMIESLENEEFQNQLSRIYADTSSVNWLSIRLCRNFLLSETDWIFLPDSGISEEDKELYLSYRKALRDLPETFTEYADDIKFPITPTIYKKLYDKDHAYLETSDQWLPLSQHHLTTYQDKMARYLMVREITDTIYFNSMLTVLESSPERPGFLADKIVEAFNYDSTAKDVELLIKLVEEGKFGLLEGDEK